MKKLILIALFGVLFLPHTSKAMSTDATLLLLAQCESGGRDTIKVLDSNGKYSYGRYQFQLATFLAFGKEYGILPEDFTDDEARLLIHNRGVQTAIARKMIDDGLHYHWKNCMKSIGVI